MEYKTYQGSTISKAQNEAPVTEYLNSFLNLNSRSGAIVFEVYNNSPVTGRVPVPDARITISRLLGDDYYLAKLITTNVSGETEPIQLPTVRRELSLKPGESRVFTTYSASVEAPGYQRQDIYDIQIFEGITSVQHVDLQKAAANRGALTSPGMR